VDKRANSTIILGETWSLAVQALRANKMRAALTMLGVIIGSACIVLVVTIALAAKHFILGQIEGVGANIVYAEYVRALEEENNVLADEISLADMHAVEQGVPQVVAAAGTRDIPMAVIARSVEHHVNLVGITENFQLIRNLVVERGRYFDQDDMNSRSKVCLLTHDLAAAVYPHDDPVGKELHVGELTFSVIGVFRERNSTFGQSEISNESIIVPFSLIRYYTGTELIKTFYAQADNPEDVPSVTRQVAEILRSRHRPQASYRVQNLSGILETARLVSLAMTGVLILIALIALAISGIGIMNIMLVTVTERTREIGIRRAIGAPRDAIRDQFLLEAVMISGSGALLGITIAVIVRFVLQTVVGLLPIPGTIPIPLSWISVLVAFAVSCSTGLIFGYLPASRAANLHPTESLRYE